MYVQHCIEMYTEHGYGSDRVANLCSVDDWYRFRFDSSKDEEACLEYNTCIYTCQEKESCNQGTLDVV